MEEKITKEDFEKLLKELKDNFANERIASENFSDEQIGMIKCWMDEAYALGVRNGKTEGVVSGISDKTFERYTDLLNGMFDKGGNEEVNVWKSMYQTQRNIVTLLMSEIYQLLCVVDKDRYDYSAMGLCSLK